jgi:DNA-binding CsgD family transcriptional regulator
VSAPSNISEHDLRRLLDVVSPDAVASPCTEIPDEVLRGLTELIPCDSVSYFVLDTHRSAVTHMQEVALADIVPDDDEADAQFWEAFWECESCCNPALLSGQEPVTMWQDFYSERDYARLLMAEYNRRMGFMHELLVCLPPQGGIQRRLMLARDASDVPFSERDRLLLTLLRPHLLAIRDRVEAERHTSPALTPRQLELLRRVAVGDTNRQVARDLGLSEGTVRKHLEHIYARLGVHSRTEAVAQIAPPLVG